MHRAVLAVAPDDVRVYVDGTLSERVIGANAEALATLLAEQTGSVMVEVARLRSSLATWPKRLSRIPAVAWDKPPRRARQAAYADAVIEAVAAHLQIDPDLMITGGQRRTLVQARQACALAMKRAGRTLPEIGCALGGVYHQAIMYSIRRAIALEASSPEFAATVCVASSVAAPRGRARDDRP